MSTTVAVRRVQAARESPAETTPTVKVGTVVQAAVDAGLVPNTKNGRSDYAAWCQRDSTAAVQALVSYRKIAAAAKTAPLPSTRPAPATPSAEPQYPSSWTPPASQAQSKGVRRDSAGQPSVVRAAQANGFRTRASAARKSAVRAGQTILAPSDSGAYLAAQANIAADTQAQAQRRLHAHTDRHTAIARRGPSRPPSAPGQTAAPQATPAGTVADPMTPRARPGVASGKMSATADEREVATPSRADRQEVRLLPEAVSPAGVRYWVCEQPVVDPAADYNDGGPHSYCAWKAKRIERGLAGPPPATGWSDVRR